MWRGRKERQHERRGVGKRKKSKKGESLVKELLERDSEDDKACEKRGGKEKGVEEERYA